MLLVSWRSVESRLRSLLLLEIDLLKPRNLIETDVLQELNSVWIDFNRVQVKRRSVRNSVISSFSLFLLKFDGNSFDRTNLDSSHEMSNEAGNLVSHPHRRDDGNLIADSFVVLKVQSKLGVVLLDHDLGSLLDGLGSNSTAFTLFLDISWLVSVSV